MRIFALTPIHVGHTELGRRQERYRRMLPEGIALELFDLDPSAPSALDTREDIERGEAMMRERFREAPSDFDVLLPDCVLDPGADFAAEFPLPYLGILRSTLKAIRHRQLRAAGVARNSAIAAALRARAFDYGFGTELSEVAVLGLDVGAITDHRAWAGALENQVRALTTRGYQAIVNGCSAVDVDDDMAEVLDPLQVTFESLSASSQPGGVRHE